MSPLVARAARPCSVRLRLLSVAVALIGGSCRHTAPAPTPLPPAAAGEAAERTAAPQPHRTTTPDLLWVRLDGDEEPWFGASLGSPAVCTARPADPTVSVNDAYWNHGIVARHGFAVESWEGFSIPVPADESGKQRSIMYHVITNTTVRRWVGRRWWAPAVRVAP